MDENSDKKLVGNFTQIDSFLPSFLMNSSVLFQNQKKVNSVSWEIEGKELLRKNSFTEQDKKIIKLLILKGIPEKKRGEFWFIASGAKKEMNEHPNYYDFLLNHYPREIELPNEKQINLDIDRTFPEDPEFHLPETKKKLFNILLCYSKRNLSIGYVQGFNFIVGRILKFIPDEERAFWVFSQIIEYILPLDFYSGMSGLIADVDILICLFKQMYIPEFADLMKECHFIYLKNVLFQWFLSLFVINFPYNASVAIWDVLFIDKSVVLFKISIYLIKLIKEELLTIKDMDLFKEYIRGYFDNFKDLNYIKNALLLRIFEFDQIYIEHNRENFLKSIVEKINKNCEYKLEKLREKTKERNDPCDKNWPFCIYECDSYYQTTNYLILRQGSAPPVFENYFDNINQRNNKADLKVNFNYIYYETALIERKNHVCNCLGKNSDNSFISTGTDRSNEKSIDNETDYHLRKSKYKNTKSKYKCISSISFTKSQKINQIETEAETDKNKGNNFEKFLSKMNYKYHLCSVADITLLTKKTEAVQPETIPLSLKI